MQTPFRSLSTEIALVTPLSFDEACSALVLVREQKTLVLDTASLEPEVAQRTVDFLSGGVLAIDGCMLSYVAGAGDALRVAQRLAELRDFDIVGDVRGRRLMMCVEYVKDKKTRERLPDSCNISKRISNACEADGLLVRPIGHLDVLSPPLTITKEQVDFVVDTLKRAILKATAELKAEGVI